MSIDQRPGWRGLQFEDMRLVQHEASGKLFEYCARCGGSGQYSFNLMDGTVCYGCMGRGYGKETTLEDAERRAKNRAKARARREAKAKAEAEEKAEAARKYRVDNDGFLNVLAAYAGDNDFLADLLAKVEYQPLTENQAAAAHRVIEVERRKAEERTKRRELGHVGTVGEKITIEVRIKRAKFVPSERWDRQSQYLVTMETEEGHLLKTWTSGQFGDDAAAALDEADRVEHADGLIWTITGTVKQHHEYNDTPETLLTRVKRVR